MFLLTTYHTRSSFLFTVIIIIASISIHRGEENRIEQNIAYKDRVEHQNRSGRRALSLRWLGRRVINFGNNDRIDIESTIYSTIHVYRGEKERLPLCNPHTTIYISLPGVLYFRFYSSELVTPPRKKFRILFLPSYNHALLYSMLHYAMQYPASQPTTCHDWLQSKSHTYFRRVRREYSILDLIS